MLSSIRRYWKWWLLPPLVLFGILFVFMLITDKSFILPAIYSLF